MSTSHTIRAHPQELSLRYIGQKLRVAVSQEEKWLPTIPRASSKALVVTYTEQAKHFICTTFTHKIRENNFINVSVCSFQSRCYISDLVTGFLTT